MTAAEYKVRDRYCNDISEPEALEDAINDYMACLQYFEEEGIEDCHYFRIARKNASGAWIDLTRNQLREAAASFGYEVA